MLLDVRTRDEVAQKPVPRAFNIPVQDLSERFGELPGGLDTPVVVFCAAGKRAGLAKSFLQRLGYGHVLNAMSADAVASALERKA